MNKTFDAIYIVGLLVLGLITFIRGSFFEGIVFITLAHIMAKLF